MPKKKPIKSDEDMMPKVFETFRRLGNWERSRAR